MQKKEKILIISNKIGRIIAYFFVIFGILGIFGAIAYKDAIIQDLPNIYTYEELIFHYNCACGFFFILVGASMLVFIELYFLKFNLYYKRGIKIQKGAIVDDIPF